MIGSAESLDKRASYFTALENCSPRDWQTENQHQQPLDVEATTPIRIGASLRQLCRASELHE